MGKKYIVEIGRLERLYKAFIGAHGKPEITWLSPEVDLTPYTEPDMEQVKEEAYDKGYENGFIAGHLKAEKSGQSFYEDGHQRGLADAWEAARKIADMPYGEEEKAFGSGGWAFVVNHTASEAIEKIRQYEQEKEEELGIKGYFKNGEEVIDAEGTKAVILRVSEDNYCQVYTEKGCIENWHIHTYKFHKTGRHFPEIAEVLQKMKEAE